MDSKYAYVQYLKPIHSGDVTAGGKLVELNRPSLAGQLDLVSASEFARLQRDFPDCIKGEVIKQDNLINMVNYCYDKLKKEAEPLRGSDDEVERRLSYLESQFEVNGVLTPDSASESDFNDLANKYFLLQNGVRDAQAREHKAGKHM